MKKDPGLVFRVCLMLGDISAIIFSFAFAYFIRTHIDHRPYYFEAEPINFILTILWLAPIWTIILSILGLYQKQIFLNRSRLPEIGRLLAASAIGIMTIITYDFFGQNSLFPVRPVAIYAAILCFFTLFFVRSILRLIRRQFIKTNHGTLKVIIIGNHQNTTNLIRHIKNHPENGYQISGIVSNNKYIPKNFRRYKYSSLKEALKKSKPDLIFQTDERQIEYVYKKSIHHHLLYYFIPSESTLSAHIGQPELIGNTPAILVKVTPLIGGSKIIKRLLDLTLGAIGLIFAILPMFIIWLLIRLSDPKSPSTYSEIRLSRYNQRFKIYKFRSIKPEYSGLSPEAAFKKMNRPSLIAKYRQNGDFLKNDPRVTKIGRFLRATSLDELPQLINVLKGDISLVGPRALVPGELRNYGDRSLILSVKSGLTGLAQVSGRRDIPFEERRALDLYYVQNWSLLLDLNIILRTIKVVLTGKGAK